MNNTTAEYATPEQIAALHEMAWCATMDSFRDGGNGQYFVHQIGELFHPTVFLVMRTETSKDNYHVIMIDPHQHSSHYYQIPIDASIEDIRKRLTGFMIRERPRNGGLLASDFEPTRAGLETVLSRN